MDEDYPRSLQELEQRFATEAACLTYLAALRWPTGFVYPACAGPNTRPGPPPSCVLATRAMPFTPAGRRNQGEGNLVPPFRSVSFRSVSFSLRGVSSRRHPRKRQRAPPTVLTLPKCAMP
jgi:hypothetical protein